MTSGARSEPARASSRSFRRPERPAQHYTPRSIAPCPTHHPRPPPTAIDHTTPTAAPPLPNTHPSTPPPPGATRQLPLARARRAARRDGRRCLRRGGALQAVRSRTIDRSIDRSLARARSRSLARSLLFSLSLSRLPNRMIHLSTGPAAPESFFASQWCLSHSQSLWCLSHSQSLSRRSLIHYGETCDFMRVLVPTQRLLCAQVSCRQGRRRCPLTSSDSKS